MITTKNAKLIALLSTILLFVGPLHAKNNELRVRWPDLPQSLIGQKVRIAQIDNKKVSGRVTRIEPDEVVLETRAGSTTIAGAKVRQIGTVGGVHRTRGQIIGTTVGAGIGILVTAAALTYTNNENGANSSKIVGASVGVAIGATLLGYLAGRESDRDRTVIYVILR